MVSQPKILDLILRIRSSSGEEQKQLMAELDKITPPSVANTRVQEYDFTMGDEKTNTGKDYLPGGPKYQPYTFTTTNKEKK